ncbi:31170_t:CDS:2, partial [Gigaspora margarita]
VVRRSQRQFRHENQKILLILDNMTNHFDSNLNNSDKEPNNSVSQQDHSCVHPRSNSNILVSKRGCGYSHSCPRLNNTTPVNQRD